MSPRRTKLRGCGNHAFGWLCSLSNRRAGGVPNFSIRQCCSGNAYAPSFHRSFNNRETRHLCPQTMRL